MNIGKQERKVPVEIYRAEASCCKVRPLLVGVSDGGFVRWRCTLCSRLFNVSDMELQEILHLEHCPKCEGNMTLLPNLSYANYGYVCEVCHIEVPLGDLIPQGDTV